MTGQVAPYGSWKSPVTADLVVSTAVGFKQIETDGGDVYWVESRPIEDGRYVVVRRTLDRLVGLILSVATSIWKAYRFTLSIDSRVR